MKWLWIVIALAFLFAGLSPQLRTRLRPAYPAVRRVRRKAWYVSGSRWAVRLEVVRL